MELSQIKAKLNKMTVERDNLKVILDNDRNKLNKLQNDLQAIMTAQALVQSVAKQTQEQLSLEIDNIVNLALQTIFPNQYKFHLKYEICRGKTEARFTLYDNADNEIDPMGALGGGCVDVITMSLRIALFALTSNNKVLIFDEPCRFLSINLRDNMSKLIKVFSDKVSVQIIQVTHIPEFEQNSNVIRIRKNKGVSEVI